VLLPNILTEISDMLQSEVVRKTPLPESLHPPTLYSVLCLISLKSYCGWSLFWYVMICHQVCGSQCFERPLAFSLYDQSGLSRTVAFTQWHIITSQKTWTLTKTTVRHSSLNYCGFHDWLSNISAITAVWYVVLHKHRTWQIPCQRYIKFSNYFVGNYVGKWYFVIWVSLGCLWQYCEKWSSRLEKWQFISFYCCG
jgi:hypothetical protein